MLSFSYRFVLNSICIPTIIVGTKKRSAASLAMGEKFFAKYLLDYDAASNILSWQWSAGTGIDPQPYFRIFTPYSQSKKFDKQTSYIKKWLPELQQIAAKHLHDEAYLLEQTIQDYPKPILVHKEARKQAMDHFKERV